VVAIVNDTVGTMMTCAYEEPSCEVGLIAGQFWEVLLQGSTAGRRRTRVGVLLIGVRPLRDRQQLLLHGGGRQRGAGGGGGGGGGGHVREHGVGRVRGQRLPRRHPHAVRPGGGRELAQRRQAEVRPPPPQASAITDRSLKPRPLPPQV